MSRIALKDLKPLANWRDAPLGALLKVRGTEDRNIFGMRCEMPPVGPMREPCVLEMTGDSRGMLLERGKLREPAIDVSALFEIVIDDPFPIPLSEQHFKDRGIVCGSALGSGWLFVRAMLQSQNRVYVTLCDPRGTPAGTVFDQKPPEVWVLGFADLSEKMAAFGRR